MFPLLFSDITKGEYYLLAATVLFLWLLPLATVVLTITTLFSRKSAPNNVIYLLSIPTIVTGIAVVFKGNPVSIANDGISFMLFVAPVVAVLLCCLVSWLSQRRVEEE